MTRSFVMSEVIVLDRPRSVKLKGIDHLVA